MLLKGGRFQFQVQGLEMGSDLERGRDGCAGSSEEISGVAWMMLG